MSEVTSFVVGDQVSLDGKEGQVHAISAVAPNGATVVQKYTVGFPDGSVSQYVPFEDLKLTNTATVETTPSPVVENEAETEPQADKPAEVVEQPVGENTAVDSEEVNQDTASNVELPGTDKVSEAPVGEDHGQHTPSEVESAPVDSDIDARSRAEVNAHPGVDGTPVSENSDLAEVHPEDVQKPSAELAAEEQEESKEVQNTPAGVNAEENQKASAELTTQDAVASEEVKE